MYRPGSSLSKAKTNKASNSTGIGLSVRNVKIKFFKNIKILLDWK